jgi:transposase
VIDMGLLNVIRRLALREKVAIREIARRTGLSRNTIKKYLNAGTIEPKFARPERASKLDPFADKLARQPADLPGPACCRGRGEYPVPA